MICMYMCVCGCVCVCLCVCHSRWWNHSWIRCDWTPSVSGRSAVHRCSSWSAQRLWIQRLLNVLQTAQRIPAKQQHVNTLNNFAIHTYYKAALFCVEFSVIKLHIGEEPWCCPPATQGATPAGRWSQMCLWWSTRLWDIHSSLEGTQKKHI